ncbi:hypothetical protein BKI52_34275 [marine bacterium AO1-C]|nr:hypothetical protein BKI52_34275 [marine bacterium AO1-C]
MGNLTPIAKGLLVINIAVFLIDQFINEGFLSAYGALYYFESPHFRPWQLLTHMFLHGGPMHLLGNMMGLFFFGPWLERSWGARNFFIFYIACGFGGAALQMGGEAFKHQQEQGLNQAKLIELKQEKIELIKYQKEPTLKNLEAYWKKYNLARYRANTKFLDGASRVFAADKEIKNLDTTNISDSTKALIANVKEAKESYIFQINKAFALSYKENATKMSSQMSKVAYPNFQMLGASGAIFGILLAFALFFPNVEMMLLFFPVPIKAKYFVLFYMAFTIYAAMGNNVGLGNVAHLAHLGGAIVGFFLARFWLWRFKY